MAEVILCVSEPEYERSSGGDLVRRRRMKEVRIAMTQSSLSLMREALDGAIDDLDELEVQLQEALLNEED